MPGAELVIDLNPYLYLVMFAIDIFELAGIIPDPIQLLLSQFEGRPRELATILQAQRLLTARNPPARIWAIELLRGLVEWGLTTSTGGSGRLILDQWFSQFVASMVSQGVTLDRARQIGTDAMSESAQSGLPLEPELELQLSDQLRMIGPTEYSTIFINQYETETQRNLTCKEALQKAEHYALKHLGLKKVSSIIVGQPIFLQQPIIPPAPDCSCPLGYTLDPVTRLCILPGQPGPPPPLPGPGTIGNPSGDEVTNDLVTALGQNTNAIINSLNQIIESQPGNPDPVTCEQLTGLITAVVTILATIQQSLPPPGGPPPPEVVVNAPVTVNVPTQPPPTVNVDIPPTDVSGIVDQLKLLVGEGDVPQPVIDALATAGFITGPDAQLISGAGWAEAIVYFFRTAAWNGLVWFCKSAGLDITGLHLSFNALSNSVAGDIAAGVKAALVAGADPMYPVVKGLIDAVVSALSPPGPVSVGNIGIDPDFLLAQTLAPIMIVNGVGLIADYFGWEISEQLKEYVDLAAGFVGLEEVRELKVGQLMRAGPMRVAEMQAKSTFRQELPGADRTYGLAAQGLITTDRARQFALYNGIPDELQTPLLQSAYRGLNARQMLRLIETGRFSDAEITDELTFTGMRQVSQARMRRAAPYLATQPERNQLKAALEAAAVAGLLADTDLTNNWDAAEMNLDPHSLVLQRVHWLQLTTETKAIETEYSSLFKAGILDDATFRSDLAGLGLQQNHVNFAAVRAEVAANVTLQKRTIADARALARATAAVERKAAFQAYNSGTIDEAALTAALVLTGLTPTEALAWTAYEVLRVLGTPRFIFGLKLSPADALLLRSRVTDLTNQRKRQLITEVAYIAALTALGLPPRWVNALNAGAEAMLTPKTAAFLVPVGTS